MNLTKIDTAAIRVEYRGYNADSLLMNKHLVFDLVDEIDRLQEENAKKDAVIASLRDSLIIRSEIRTDIEQVNFDMEAELDQLSKEVSA